MPTRDELEAVLKRHVVDAWFPRCLDLEHGGFLCDFDRAWQTSGPNDKFLEFQARQTWLAALVARYYPEDQELREAARHGLRCLSEVMWDSTYGGWYHRLERNGTPRDDGRKHAHGSAYAIAACAEASVTLGDPAAMELAHTGFSWLDQYSRDREHGGYFGFLTRDGTVIRDPSGYSRAMDPIETPIGLKDANVNTDLVETFNVLLAVEPDEAVRERLDELARLIVAHTISPEGNLVFYWRPDWTPLPGVRFGTQLQTAHRLAVTALLLGTAQLDAPAGRLFRGALEYGWDGRSGGFRFADFGHRPQRREWWSHVECLRALATLGPLAGDDGERHAIENRVWRYLRRSFIDERHAGLYMESLDGLTFRQRARGRRFAPAFAVAKGTIWKDGWHEGKALLVALGDAEPAVTN